MTRDLRTYLTEIRKSKDLKTIKKPVSLKYEIATITEKFEDSNAILFENVKGRKFPVVSNLIGTRARFAQAIGAKIPDIHQKMVKAISATKKPKISNSAKFFENSSNNIAFESSNFSVIVAISYFRDTGFLMVLRSLDFLISERKVLRSLVIL